MEVGRFFEVFDVDEAMTKVVASKPADFYYCKDGTASCFYRPVSDEFANRTAIPAGDPRRSTGCIAGETIKVLSKNLYDLLIEDRAITNQPEIILRRFSEDAIEFLREAQVNQDVGKTWAQTLAAAQRYINDRKGI